MWKTNGQFQHRFHNVLADPIELIIIILLSAYGYINETVYLQFKINSPRPGKLELGNALQFLPSCPTATRY